MQKFVCPVCGYSVIAEAAPEKCPVCGVPGSKFKVEEADAVHRGDLNAELESLDVRSA